MSLSSAVPAEALADLSHAPPFPGGRTQVEAVVRPRTTDEVSAMLRWASGARMPVVPVGTGRHLPRFVQPERCVVLALDRMTGIERYEPADLTFTASAGTPLAALGEELARHRQWLPFDPPDAHRRSLGGLVASGQGGPLSAGYGALRNHVLGATAVFGDGRVVRLGGRVVKNVAGFDLLRPLVGSHGSLAVLTSLSLRVFPLPETDRILVLRARDPLELTRAARALATAAVLPASIVLTAGLAGAASWDGPRGADEDAGPEPEGRALLVVRLHGPPEATNADRRHLEGALGGPLEEVPPEAVAPLLAAVRDHPLGREGVGIVAALPDRLGSVLEAVVHALGDSDVPRFAADPLEGRVRFSFGLAHVPALIRLRRAIESMDGTVGVERLPDIGSLEAGPGLDPDDVVAAVARAVSRPSDGEEALSRRVRAVFDPDGVMGAFTDAPAAVEALR